MDEPPQPSGHPGPDEILVSAAHQGQACSDRAHRNQGRAAELLITFGELGSPGQDFLWRECWGRSYPMCGACWDRTRRTAEKFRADLVVTDMT
jgi:hypothetical protein